MKVRIVKKIEKHIGRIKSSVQNLTNILNDFLSLDKLEEGNIRINPTEIYLREAVEDTIDELEAVVKAGQAIQVDYELENEVVFADPQIIKNIIINLTSNAIKYSDEGKEIKLEISLLDNVITIKVTDQGIGIPKNEQRHMFERFFRAKNVTNIEGTGLGFEYRQEIC